MKNFLLIVVLIVSASLWVVFTKSNLLNAKNVQIKLNQAQCVDPDQLKSSLKLQNQKIIFIDQTSIEQRIKKSNLCVATVSLDKKLPDTLIVNITGRKAEAVLDSVEFFSNNQLSSITEQDLEATPSSQPAFVLKDEEDQIKQATPSGRFFVDSEGLAFEGFNGIGSLPNFIFAGEKLDLGKRIDPILVRNSINILSRLHGMSINITSTPIIFDNSLFLETDKSPKLNFSLNGDINRELASLQLILGAGTMNSAGSPTGGKSLKGIESIDLRFNKPVVVYSK